jgi:hypothetical protein
MTPKNSCYTNGRTQYDNKHYSDVCQKESTLQYTEAYLPQFFTGKDNENK